MGAGLEHGTHTILHRYACPTDGAALARLEGLSGRSLVVDPILVAESDEELVAAVSTTGGEIVSDPFR